MFPASFNVAQPKQTSRTEHFARPAREIVLCFSHVGLNVGLVANQAITNLDNVAVLMV